MFNLGSFTKRYELELNTRVSSKTLIRLLMLLVATGGIGACSRQEQVGEGDAEAITPQIWAPSEYRWDSRQLPLLDYANQPGPFFIAFKNEWEELKKKEYETTKEFNLRMENERFSSRFSRDALYAFPLNDATLTYNADSQSFESSGYMCWWDTTISDQAACPLGRVTDSNDRYQGRNAYGVTAEVERSSGREFYLAVQRKNLSGKMFRRPLPFEYDLNINCKTPIELAKSIAGKNAKILVVGRLRARELLTGNISYESPTIGSPIEEYFETQAIPFEISGFVCYDSRTGAVLDSVKI